MNKEEARSSVIGAISMTLKNSTLQQGFEIICKNLSDLEKENKELKEVHESDKRSLRLIAEKGAELEKELEQAKKVQIVEHFDAYGQSRDSRRIAGLEARNEELNTELIQAEELLKWFVWYFREGDSNLVPYKHKVAEAEQFLSEVEND